MLGRIFFLGFFLFSASVSAASFDCTKAATFAEKEICRDGFLSGMDKILADEYKKAMKDAVDKEALKKSQNAWIQTRDACTIQKCVDISMSERIYFLKYYWKLERKAAISSIPPATTESEKPYKSSSVVATKSSDGYAPTAAAQIVSQSPPPYVSGPAIKSYPAEKNERVFSSQAAKPQDKTQALSEGPLWKYITIALVCVVGASLFFHHQGKLSIYTNYTDAAITNALPLAGGVAYALMSWLEFPEALVTAIVVGIGILWLAFSIFTSFIVNDSAWKVAFSLVSKLLLVSVFYVVAAVLIASLISTKYKDETRAQAAARNRRGNRETMVYLGGFATGYSFMTRWLCRDGRFTSVAECLGLAPISSEV